MLMKIKIALGMVALTAAFVGGFMFNGARWSAKYSDLQKEYAEAESAQRAEVARVTKLRQEKSDLVAQAIIAEMDAESTQAEVIEKEVVRYEKSNDAGGCDMPDSWVRLHNRAARAPGDTKGSAPSSD